MAVTEREHLAWLAARWPGWRFFTVREGDWRAVRDGTGPTQALAACSPGWLSVAIRRLAG